MSGWKKKKKRMGWTWTIRDAERLVKYKGAIFLPDNDLQDARKQGESTYSLVKQADSPTTKKKKKIKIPMMQEPIDS